MRASELKSKPHLYLDMDGVTCDFFGDWARLHGVSDYKDIGDEKARENSIKELNARGPEFVYKFFRDLPVLPGGREIIDFLVNNNIPFTVLSAPLRGNEEASVKGKREWLARHNPAGAKNPIFTHDKQKYALSDGQANLLVDDYGVYVGRWRNAGGQAIKHDDSNTADTIKQLTNIYLK